MTLDRNRLSAGLLASLVAISPGFADAHESDRDRGGVQAEIGNAADPNFDIEYSKITLQEDHVVEFRIHLVGQAGASKPEAKGQLLGSEIYAYIWPTTLDPAFVGFEAGSGILSLAVMAHPDFDATPLFDENRDGELANDGDVWAAHWIVLAEDGACATTGLKIADIPQGRRPAVPPTWPGLPLLLDSPGWQPTFNGEEVAVMVAFEDIHRVQAAKFDGVTASLSINPANRPPLMCLTELFDVASGDLSLPGEVD